MSEEISTTHSHYGSLIFNELYKFWFFWVEINVWDLCVEVRIKPLFRQLREYTYFYKGQP